jgi:hypothetical protein
MRVVGSLFARVLACAGMAVAALAATGARAGDTLLPFEVASLEPAPRSVIPTRYDDLSDLLSGPADLSLDPVLSRVTDNTLLITTGRVPRRGTLAGALRGAGVDPILVDQFARGLRPVFDFRGARPGDFYALIRDNQGKLLSFEYQRGRADVYRLERDALGSLVAKRETAPLDRRVLQLGGVVRSSLFESMRELGERPELVYAFADIFAWDFDFSKQTRPGDEFRMVFEKYFDRRRPHGRISRPVQASSRTTSRSGSRTRRQGDFFRPTAAPCGARS